MVRADLQTTPPDESICALLDELTEPQLRAVTSDATPLCVVAAAGAGKTRVLTRRVAYRCSTGSADPAHVLALTFTRRAAGELAERLRRVGLREHVAAGTFHAVAAAQLRRWWADRGQATPTLLERKARLLGPLAAERPGLAGVPLAELAGIIEWAQARRVGPDELRSSLPSHAMPAPAGEVASLLSRYQHEKRRRGLVDFDDLLERCADAIESDPTFAAAQRWRWRHLFVDEVQDLNPLQRRLLLAWLGERVDLCVVGDPHQAIYGWNGADVDLLERFSERWPSGEVVHLDANHRCTPQIVTAAASVLGPAGRHLGSSRPEGSEVDVRSWPSDQAEAAGVAAAIRAAHDEGFGWSALAVLTRTNAQAVFLAEACRAASIPVRVPDEERLLEHPVARAALRRLSSETPRRAPLAVAVADLEAWAEDADAEAAGVLDSLASLARQVRRLDETASVADWIAGLPCLFGPAPVGEALEQGGSGKAPPAPGSRHPGRSWRPSGPAAPEAVTICSFHRAKGLEWRAVWVCGLEDGLVPIGRASSPPAIAEERRLLYVALTRATDRLCCSWARVRRLGGHPVPRHPSPWLPAASTLEPSATARGGVTDHPGVPDHPSGTSHPGAPARPGSTAHPGVEGDSQGAPASTERERWSARFEDQRDRLSAVRQPTRDGLRSRLPAGWPPPDPVALEALRAWRACTAHASAVPASVVLHDTVLLALAARRPTDVAGLLAIPGLGPVKVSRFGPRLLELLAEASNPTPPTTGAVGSPMAGARAAGYT